MKHHLGNEQVKTFFLAYLSRVSFTVRFATSSSKTSITRLRASPLLSPTSRDPAMCPAISNVVLANHGVFV